MSAKEIAQVIAGERRWHVECGDNLEVLKGMPDNCVDSMVCDPPAGISFMSKKWDSDHGGRDKWVARMAERFAEAFRVLKPGAHGLVWAIPRTAHWTALALENAGFYVVDKQFHIFGSGFPKSVDVSRAIDKRAGVEREVVGPDPQAARRNKSTSKFETTYGIIDDAASCPVTAPATDAKKWSGWGTALKPAVEEWILVRKPFKGTIVDNVLKQGTGAINIDGCRVPHASSADLEAHAAGVSAIKARGGSMDNSWKNSSDLSGANDVTAAGRWPANCLFSHAPGCERVGTKKVKAAPSWNDNRGPSLFTGETTSPVHHTDGDGFETVDAWQCVDGCPVKELDEQSGISTSQGGRPSSGEAQGMHNWKPSIGPSTGGLGDTGGASRYFTTFAPFLYTAKANRSEREQGLEHMSRRTGGEATGRKDGSEGLKSPRAGAGRGGGRANDHPTVKSDELMRHLCRLVTPPNGICVDIFTGSGSTGKACSAEGFRFIGIELDEHYCEIARARISGDMPLFNRAGGT